MKLSTAGLVLVTLLTVCLPQSANAAPPRIGHVVVIVLENQSFSVTFGKDTPAPYLGKVLTAQGALLRRYYATGHASLDNYITMISGQWPNEDTQRDCGVFKEFVPSSPQSGAQGQISGRGCIYPSFVKSLPDQLEAKGYTWRAYMEDMGKDPSRERATCGHSPIGAHETLNEATIHDQYAVKHDPFMYFHSIIDDRARCDTHVVPLDRLATDLATTGTTSNFTYIVPNLCNDGHDHPCVDGTRGGLPVIDSFLQKWVPQILNSPAFQKDGLLVVTFDEADSADSEEDSLACCGEEPMPGAAFPPGGNGPGGGRIGAVLLSRFIVGGTVSDQPYNHYSLLRTIEDIFGLDHLAGAGAAGVQTFGADIFGTGTRP